MARLGKFVARPVHTDHPDLEGRMRVSARMAIAIELRMHTDVRRRVGEAVGQLAVAARNEADQTWRTSPGLEPFLTSISQAVGVRARSLGLENDTAVSRFDSALAEMNCTICAERTGNAVCTRQSNAAFLSPVGALCYATIFDLFRFLVTLAEEYYIDVLPSNSTALEIRLKTQVAQGQDLGASTRFPPDDQPNARCADIMLDIPTEHLDERHVGRFPYLMFHEIFVHAPESLRAKSVRYPSDERNAFREGFLDRAAFKILENRLYDSNGLPPTFRGVVFPIIQEIRIAHDERLEFGSSTKGPDTASENERSYVSSRRLGQELFERLERSFDLEFAILLSARLNVIELTADQQATLLELIDLATEARDFNRHQLQRGRWLDLFGELQEALIVDDTTRIVAVIDQAFDSADY